MSVATLTSSRSELDARSSDGIEVTLSFDKEANEVWLEVEDHRTGVSFLTTVPADQARYAFLHPFLYQPALVRS